MAIESLFLCGLSKEFLHRFCLSKTFTGFCRPVLGNLNILSVKEILIYSIISLCVPKRVLNITTEKCFRIGYVSISLLLMLVFNFLIAFVAVGALTSLTYNF
jgi:hypothetical protein